MTHEQEPSKLPMHVAHADSVTVNTFTKIRTPWEMYVAGASATAGIITVAGAVLTLFKMIDIMKALLS